MRTINKRLANLERPFVPSADRSTDWGKMGRFRDELLRSAEHRGASAVAQLKKELDERGPSGLWLEVARSYLRDHGFVQSGGESFAETVTRALGIDIEELKACMAEGRIGSALVNRFADSEGQR